MNPLLRDLRYSFRMLLKSPGLAAAAILSLAIGIGANTAIFSVTNGLLLQPLPYPAADRLALIWLHSPGLGILQDWPSPGQFIDLRTQSRSFEEMTLVQGFNMTITGKDEPQRVGAFFSQSNFFSMLGAKPALGRLLLPEEDLPGKPAVAILSHGLWKRMYGGDPSVLNKSVTINSKQYTIVGVLSPEFLLNHEIVPTVGGIENMEIFLPLPLDAKAQQNRGDENYNILVRLKPGVKLATAQADVDVIASRIREIDKRDPTYGMTLTPLLDQVVGDVRRAVLVLLGSVTLVLLIACANVANLLLARATGRAKELAIRTALGAGRGRLIRQLLTEAVTLSAIGGLLGLGVAWAALRVIRVINPGNIPRLDQIGLDARVLAFTFAISVITGIVFGLAPALRVSRVDLNTTLKAGGRTGQTEGGLLSRHGLRGLLVVAELALSLMLLVGAGLLIRSFVRLSNVPPGFNPQGVMSMEVSLSGTQIRKDPQKVQFFEQLEDKLRQLPGVKQAGAASVLPLTSAVSWGGFTIEDYTPPPNQPELQVDQRVVTPGYFPAMEIPLKEGRFCAASDTHDSPPVVVIDEQMARHFFPNTSAVGKRAKPGERDSKAAWMTIIGVVGDVKQYGLEADGRMVAYYCHKQNPDGGMWVVARTDGDAAGLSGLSGAMTRTIRSFDPNVVVYSVDTMETRLFQSLARQRFAMIMLTAFAGFALILAAVGIYGVMSYLVSQGARDIGIRMALGAEQSRILGMVFRQGAALTAAGLIAGLAGAFALTRLMASLLFGVGASDALTFSSVAILLAAVALAASYVPARRATRVDPLVALRDE